MNVDKTRVSRKTRWTSALDADAAPVDRENVLDLLTVIDDNRRFHAAAAVLSEDPVEGEHYRAMAREAMALLAEIRHGLAHIARGHLSQRDRARQFERFARRLMAPSQRPRRYALSSTTNLQGPN